MKVSPLRRTTRWSYAPLPTAAGSARAQLSAQLLAWGVGEDDAEPAVLIASELVSNAVEHAGTALELGVSFEGSVISLTVRDHSPRPPRLQPHSLNRRAGTRTADGPRPRAALGLRTAPGRQDHPCRHHRQQTARSHPGYAWLNPVRDQVRAGKMRKCLLALSHPGPSRDQAAGATTAALCRMTSR